MSNKSEQKTGSTGYLTEKLTGIYTKLLKREVEVELFLPPNFQISGKKYPLLLLNDGQDSASVRVKETVEQLTKEALISDIIVVGVRAGDRMQEYGVASKPDYLKRGSHAKAYTRYIVTELIPYLLYKYPVDMAASQHAIAGYSMGGLSALDIMWNHPRVFSKVGVFSGSLWWRKRDSKSRFYNDSRDRIMHMQIRNDKLKKGLKFWFQAGTDDERSDRNKNGVIDSIDDTLDLIAELTKKGYRPFHDIQYLEIKEGRHNTETWSQAFPYFLMWAFPKT